MNDELKEKFREAIQDNASNPFKVDYLSHKKPFIIGIVFVLILFSINILTDKPQPIQTALPEGELTSPNAGSRTGQHVTVIGETATIGVGQYIWFSVDKPKIGLCWPKQHVKSNTKFSTTIRGRTDR